MKRFLKEIKTKKVLFVLAVCCPLILCCILSPAFRYEKTSMGGTEIRYDKFTGVIYLKNSPNMKAEWIPTGHKNIMEAKYHLAEKQLEETFKEIRTVTLQEPSNGVRFDRVVVIPASP
jgi:hypothetical protein